VRDCNWLQHYENVVDPYHLFALHTMISGAQFLTALAVHEVPEIRFERTPLGVRYLLRRTLPSGLELFRCSECIVPNAYLVPNIHERGERPIAQDRASELSWAVPVDDTHVTGFSIVARPLRDGAPDPTFWPRTDTVTRDEHGNIIRPGHLRDRPYEERQRAPDDMEAQEGQRAIAIHALEHLGRSDQGIRLLRELLRQNVRLVAEGQDPMNIFRDEAQNRAVPTHAWNTVEAPAAAGAPA